MKNKSTFSGNYIEMALAILILIVLFLFSRYNYLLFHSLVEIFSIIVACGIFMIFWYARKYAILAIETAKQSNMGRFQGYSPTAKGTPGWWDVVITPLVDGNGKVESLLSISRNITAGKLVNKELQASEEKNRAFLEAVPDIMFHMDSDGTILDYKNPTDQKTLVPPDEFIGKNTRDILPLEIAQKTMEHIEMALRTGDIQIFEYQLQEKGDLNYYEARIVASGVDKVLVIVRNITDRPEVDEKRRKLNEELEQRVEERTAELEYKNAELEQMNKLFMGRELKMIELKERIAKLEKAGFNKNES